MDIFSVQEIQKCLRGLPLLTRVHFWLRLFSFPFEAILPFVRTTGLVVDVGCGFGYFSYLLAKINPQRRVIAFDSSIKKIHVARRILEKFKNVTVLEASNRLSTSLPRAMAIVIIDVLYLLPYSKKCTLFQELAARLKPGGLLLVSIVPKERSLRYFLAYLQELLMVYVFAATKSSCGVIEFETREQTEELFRKAGFKQIRVYNLPSPFPFFHKHLLFTGVKL